MSPAGGEGVDLPIADRAFVAAHMFATVRAAFAHWEGLADYDLDEAFRSCLQEALTAPDRKGFSLAAIRFVAGLRNGHTAFDDRWLWEHAGAPIGLDVVRVGGEWAVRASAHPDIPVGATVAALDGVSLDAVFAQTASWISGSSERERAGRFFARPYLFPRRFRLELGCGTEHSVVRGRARLVRPTEVEGRWIERDELFLLTLPSFETPACEAAALRIVESLPSHCRLIVDIRGNGGGDTPENLVAALMPQPYQYWQSTSTVRPASGCCDGFHSPANPAAAAARWPARWHHPRPGAFAGPMAILLDGGTFSAAEDFAVPFKNNGRARLLGETSGGSSGQPIVQDLGHGLRLWVSTRRQWRADGSEFEGVGIEPDIRLSTTPADWAADRDPVLEHAVAMLGRT